MKAIRKYFSESVAEIQKVTWPTKTELVQITIAVIVIGAVCTLAVGILDFLFSLGYKALLEL